MRLGRYHIVNRVATGGMAEIFRATTTTGKLIAIKKILPQHIANERFIKMFFDEAKIMILLRHPNIVQLFDFGKVENDYFLALEWIEGKALSSLIHQQKKQRVSFPPGLACYVMLEALCGLEYAHSRKDSFNRKLGIVHRDISPPNILISIQGDVKIADFGIAKAESNVSLTNPGVLKGKYSYMSPEQASGEEIDERSDVFSCGTLFYEMLTSTRLFLGGNDVETLRNVREKRIPELGEVAPHLPRELVQIVERALQRKVGKRYETSADMANDLERVYTTYYKNDNREALRGFFQFLYPRAAIFPNREDKRALIEYWGKRLQELPAPVEQRSWWRRNSLRVILLVALLLLLLSGLIFF